MNSDGPAVPETMHILLILSNLLILFIFPVVRLSLSYPSLYQWPRTIAQDRLFVQALMEMAGLYASAGSTCVIQIKYIPPRPSKYNGKISLKFAWDVLPGELLKRLAEHPTLLTDALTSFEKVSRTSAEETLPALCVKECDRRSLEKFSRATVTFASHEEAVRVVAALEMVCKQLETCKSTGVKLPERTTDLLSPEFLLLAPSMTAKLYYNDLPYDDRGWCLFESFASLESMVWLGTYPSVKHALSNLSNNKLYQVQSDGSSSAIDPSFKQPPSFGSRKNALEQATFTGAADKTVVVRMYHTFRTDLAGQVRKVSTETVEPNFDKTTGYGTELRPGGDVYEGYFNKRTGLKEGKGRMSYATGDVFEGLWKKGVKEGRGRSEHAMGDVYEGEFSCDLRNGEGTYWFANGNIYEGQWKDNKYHGAGTLLTLNGMHKVKCDGWIEGKKGGKVEISRQQPAALAAGVTDPRGGFDDHRGMRVTIQGDQMTLYDTSGVPKVLSVQWGTAHHHDCDGEIRFVDPTVNGLVELTNGETFQNPAVHGDAKRWFTIHIEFISEEDYQPGGAYYNDDKYMNDGYYGSSV